MSASHQEVVVKRERHSERHWLVGWVLILALAVPLQGSGANAGNEPAAADSAGATSASDNGSVPREAAPITAAAQDAAPADPNVILARAFSNQYEVDLISKIELRMKNDEGQERTRRFEALQKIVGDRLHAIGRLTYPEYLRGMTILQIEEPDRTHEAFVYMPSLHKVRRVSMLQRGDAVFGTDVTYEDLERRHVEDYQIVDFEEGEIRGEPVFVIDTVPTRTLSAERVVFYIAQLDDVILEIYHYRDEKPEPFRIISITRAGMVEADGHLLATRLTVRNLYRGTTTEVTFEEMQVNPKIDDRIFSLRTLEQERDLYRSFR
jgi:hypothetical protein